jgi:hypothetical protein
MRSDYLPLNREVFIFFEAGIRSVSILGATARKSSRDFFEKKNPRFFLIQIADAEVESGAFDYSAPRSVEHGPAVMNLLQNYILSILITIKQLNNRISRTAF